MFLCNRALQGYGYYFVFKNAYIQEVYEYGVVHKIRWNLIHLLATKVWRLKLCDEVITCISPYMSHKVGLI